MIKTHILAIIVIMLLLIAIIIPLYRYLRIEEEKLANEREMVKIEKMKLIKTVCNDRGGYIDINGITCK